MILYSYSKSEVNSVCTHQSHTANERSKSTHDISPNKHSKYIQWRSFCPTPINAEGWHTLQKFHQSEGWLMTSLRLSRLRSARGMPHKLRQPLELLGAMLRQMNFHSRGLTVSDMPGIRVLSLTLRGKGMLREESEGKCSKNICENDNIYNIYNTHTLYIYTHSFMQRGNATHISE